MGWKSLKVQEAVIVRIRDLCKEKNMKISQLAYDAGMPPSTLKNNMNGNSNNTGIVTIKIICDGLGVSLDDFFRCALFKKLDEEIV